VPVKSGWVSVTFDERPGLAGGLHFEVEAEPEACLREIQARLRTFEA
jgi:hypothetical protein